MKLLLVPIVASIIALSACHLPANATSAEKQIYADLVTAQSALNDLKAEEPQYPQIKDSLNVAISAFNVAEKSFVDYENSKKLSLSNPADLATIQTELVDLKASITAVGASVKGATK